MSKTQLIEAMAAKSGLTKADSSRALEAFMSTVAETLKKGDKIVLTALSAGVSKKDIERKEKYLKAVSNLEKEGFKIFAPPMKYCTDNASMVASSAYFLANTMDDLSQEVFSRVK